MKNLSLFLLSLSCSLSFANCETNIMKVADAMASANGIPKEAFQIESSKININGTSKLLYVERFGDGTESGVQVNVDSQGTKDYCVIPKAELNFAG